jgi:hypothetical protein
MSAIPISLYQEIMDDIAPAEIEDIDVTIKLANRDTIQPLGIVRDVKVLCGKVKYPTDFHSWFPTRRFLSHYFW